MDRVKKRFLSQPHTQLTEEVQLRTLDRGTPAYQVSARKSSEAFESGTESERGLPMSSCGIKKTVQVDFSEA